MDALLRYILYQVAYSLLYLELILMVVCCLAIIITKLITKWISRRRERIQNEISNRIETALFSQEPIENLTIPSKFTQFRNLVEVLEKFDHRFNDPRWTEIKEKIVTSYLLPRSEQYANSFSWFKRQLAARSYLLYPQKASEEVLNKLLDDHKYLVRVATAVCITKTSYHKLFDKMIYKMSKETSLSQFPYRDALMQANPEKYAWMEALLIKEKDNAIIAICLDVLSTRYYHNLLPLIRPLINNPDRDCRILAVKALGNIPSNESIELLTSHLVDSDWEIRAESVLGLQKLYAIQAIPKIRYLLNDPVWWVRLQAALTLKNFGKEGIDILSRQDPKETPRAYEIAQYTLALP